MVISGTQLKQIRTDRGWSQEVLAKTSGLSLRTIQRIERENNASAESVLALSAALEISPKQLQSIEQSLDVNWTGKKIMQAFIALTLVILLTLTLFNFASKIGYFLDAPTFIATFAFSYLWIALSYGTDGVLKSLRGIRYLFAKDITGGKSALYLKQIYNSQITATYTSALLVFVIGLMATIRGLAMDPGKMESYLIYSVPIIFAPILYSLLVCESVFRPLKNKLAVCDISAE